MRLAERLERVPGVASVSDTFFNEFTLRLPRPAAPVVEALARRGILGGVPASRFWPDRPELADLLLVAATETNTEDEMDAFAAALAGGAAMSDWSKALSGFAPRAGRRQPTIAGSRSRSCCCSSRTRPAAAASICPSRPRSPTGSAACAREGAIGLPGLSEPQVVRHYTRLSQKNYGIDTGLYPLGSCTMKHNPRLNEKLARLPGFADLHPMQPLATVQGALELIDTLAHWLKTLTGMPAVAMTPAAGAHGELCGMMCIRAALEARGERRSARAGAGIGARHQSGDRRDLRLRGRSDPGQSRAAGSISPRSRRSSARTSPRSC